MGDFIVVKLLTILILLSVLRGAGYSEHIASTETSPSIDYVMELGGGWNLGNAFDSYDIDEDQGERTWENPIVTRSLMREVKAQGFDSIRIPLSVVYRMDQQYNLDVAYLDRFEEVVNWALEEDLYVLINLHHDSKEWLMRWDGRKSSEEYQKFSAIWEQLAERFKDYDERLFFESINEPYFEVEVESLQYKYLAKLNQAFHQIVRNSGGLNAQRMLVLPTILSQDDQPKLEALLKEIERFKDPNLIASVHYYGEWEFSNNLGVLSLDEPIHGGTSQRQQMEDFIHRLKATFVSRGIGVLIGEYGLLGYDRHPEANNIGETHKYIAYLNELTRAEPIALMLWDNGQHFNRITFEWQPLQFGDSVIQSMFVESAYAVHLDSTFVNSIDEGAFIELAFNGASLEEVLHNGQHLKSGLEYDVNETGVYIYPQVLQNIAADAMLVDSGSLGTFTLKFDQGAAWNQQVYLVEELVFQPSETRVGDDLSIPVNFGGHLIRRGAIYDEQGQPVTQNEGWPYLTFMEELVPDYQQEQLVIPGTITEKLHDKAYELRLETYTGQSYSYWLRIEEGMVEGWP